MPVFEELNVLVNGESSAKNNAFEESLRPGRLSINKEMMSE